MIPKSSKTLKPRYIAPKAISAVRNSDAESVLSLSKEAPLTTQ